MTVLLTVAALVAFAANSILCRLALQPGAIDPASFTAARLASGAIMLAIIARGLRRARGASHAGSWASAFLLFLYALPFSVAYVSLGVATGALILFFSVQATMLLGAVVSGERIHWLEINGIAIALAGLAHLMKPGLSAPPAGGAALMALAGMAWGLYSLRGRRSADPIGDTASNFVRAAPMALAALGAAAPLGQVHLSSHGILLACGSGILASGAGYAAWFAALPKLSSLQAAALQLTVPLIAAVGGIALLGEHPSRRLVLSAVFILGGVALVIAGRMIRARRAAPARAGERA